MNNANGGESNETITDGLERLTKVEKVAKAKAAAAEEKLASMADSAIENLGDDAEEIRTRFEAFEAKLRQGSDRLLENVRSVGGATSKQMSAHPLIAVGIAFVAGMAAIRYLRR